MGRKRINVKPKLVSDAWRRSIFLFHSSFLNILSLKINSVIFTNVHLLNHRIKSIFDVEVCIITHRYEQRATRCFACGSKSKLNLLSLVLHLWIDCYYCQWKRAHTKSAPFSGAFIRRQKLNVLVCHICFDVDSRQQNQIKYLPKEISIALIVTFIFYVTVPLDQTRPEWKCTRSVPPLPSCVSIFIWEYATFCQHNTQYLRSVLLCSLHTPKIITKNQTANTCFIRVHLLTAGFGIWDGNCAHTRTHRERAREEKIHNRERRLDEINRTLRTCWLNDEFKIWTFDRHQRRTCQRYGI